MGPGPENLLSRGLRVVRELIQFIQFTPLRKSVLSRPSSGGEIFRDRLVDPGEAHDTHCFVLTRRPECAYNRAKPFRVALAQKTPNLCKLGVFCILVSAGLLLLKGIDMIISWSNSITDARMRKLECGLEDFMDIFKPENVKEQPTKDGRNYIAGQLLDYTLPRGKGNVINRCAVVLDCDDADKAGIKALVEGVRGLGVRSVVHSTYSSTPDKPRVRVVIPLKDEVVPGDYVSLCKVLMNHLNMVTWDESCAQAERAMYMPAKPEGGDYWAVDTPGPLMDGQEWLKAHAPAERKTRTSKGNIAKRDKRRKPENDPGIQGAFNRAYTISDAIEEFDLPYEPVREGRWTYYGSHTQGGLRLVEGREDLCISEHANTDPACFVDGNGSVRALSAFELCAIHLYGEDDDTTVPPRERASMQKMGKRAGEDEAVRAELKVAAGGDAVDVSWLPFNLDNTYLQAKKVAEVVRDRLAYVDGLGWLVYSPDLGTWQLGGDSAALGCIADVSQLWYEGAVRTGDVDLVKKVGKLQRVSVTSGILKHLPWLLTVPVSSFDADMHLVCALNGVVDTRTRKLMPHDSKYKMVKHVNAEYVPGATYPAWDKALEALDAPERAWLQRWIGCALTGYQPDDHGAVVPILLGSGSNGKSVIMTAIKRAFGEYSHVGVHALLSPRDGKALLQAAAPLRGARLCIIEEFPDSVMKGNAIKQLSATPTMKGEYKYKNEFTFNATHSLMVSSNRLPRLDDCTDAVMRRVTVLPFTKKYAENPDKKQGELPMDVNLLRELDTPEARAAILAWAVEGAEAYFAAGQHVLPSTEAMEAAKNNWLEETDTLASFFAEKLIEDESGMIPRDHLYAAFADFQRENGGAQWNKATFMNSLSSHRAFSRFKYGKLRTTGMSLYRDRYGNGPAAPTGGRAAGLRGLRFRTPADDELEAFDGEYVEPEVEVEPEVVAPEPEALIPVEDVPALTPHVALEAKELERQELIEELDGLACYVRQLPGGVEEVNRLAYETGATSRQAPLEKLRAFKIRLEGALVRLAVQHREERGIPFAGDSRAHRQE